MTTTITDKSALREVLFASHIEGNRDELCRFADSFCERMRVEQWAEKMGWRIPAFGTPEWAYMKDAWMHDLD